MSGKSKAIIFGAIILIIILIFLKKRKKIISMNALDRIAEKYGEDMAEVVDRLFRHETGHYTSGGFEATNGAGILAMNSEPPYGWYMLENFWSQNPDLKPTGVWSPKTSDYNYIKFPSVYAGMSAVAEILKNKIQNKGHIGYYYSNTPQDAHSYLQRIKGINPSRLRFYNPENELL